MADKPGLRMGMRERERAGESKMALEAHIGAASSEMFCTGNAAFRTHDFPYKSRALWTFQPLVPIIPIDDSIFHLGNCHASIVTR